MDAFERTVIEEHAFRNLENLSLALKVGEMCDDIKNEVMSRFLISLSTELRSKLATDSGSWEIDNPFGANPLGSKWSGIYIAKQRWHKTYRIGMETDSYNATN